MHCTNVIYRHLTMTLFTLAIITPSFAMELPWVRVGEPGQGGVDYVYYIGRYEITNAQYVDFLNHVAHISDPYGLYDQAMADSVFGCRIKQSGVEGAYTYSVPEDRAHRPVNYISWGDAARFCNWLENGRPTGLQSMATTEDGSYRLDGAMEDSQMTGIARKPSAHYVLPNDQEWKKAAYFDPSKSDAPDEQWWQYPTQSDVPPDNNPLSNSTNNANYKIDGHYALGSPYWTAPVGQFSSSPSHYGTDDQAGNVWEWTETFTSDHRVLTRGGAFDSSELRLRKDMNFTLAPQSSTSYAQGFRVVLIPEPACLALFLIGKLLVSRPR